MFARSPPLGNSPPWVCPLNGPSSGLSGSADVLPAPFQGAAQSSHQTQGGVRGLTCPGLIYFGPFGALGDLMVAGGLTAARSLKEPHI